jgi:hypothetical protein
MFKYNQATIDNFTHTTQCWNLVLVMPHAPYKYIGTLVSNLTLGSMDKCKKKLYDLSQMFTHVGGHKL